MKLYYVTLNNPDEARQIGRALLERKLAVCVNWFPITCAYIWQGEITEEPEVVLIIKTQNGYTLEIEKVIREYISYTNFIGEISPIGVNEGFLNWLNTEVSPRPALEVT
ncbi:divalent-cation tolerance protein CutA [Nostoc sp. FACHB-110]|uniref:divalent-cation tolerance protein CutA n=1 Tax=Nostoc sp. FACHB-110 TaxID=2692834 RepID=UPI0016885220|nr:divalent-cation tolerance protein CutA [Nostoc sp. FACHB-110]MBD2435520.1 divalent-cation tolerance protein CutA [Nostoc sp. FACHB-110]